MFAQDGTLRSLLSCFTNIPFSKHIKATKNVNWYDFKNVWLRNEICACSVKDDGTYGRYTVRWLLFFFLPKQEKLNSR